MNIGFDLDKVFINYPPFIPAELINWLYKNHRKKQLSYRIPTTSIERFIRKISHISLFRPKINENVLFINNFAHSLNPHRRYLISSRYSFLNNLTYKLLKKYGLYSCFNFIYLNTQDEQPHLFKARLIKKLKIDIFIDDDLELLTYLKKCYPKMKLFWYKLGDMDKISDGIIQINNLEKIYPYLK